MLSYGEICKDHGKAKEHLKEASDSFAKVAKKAEKPPLFEKFKRAIIDRGTWSKQLKEACHQFEPPKPKFQPLEPMYQSSLQRVQPEQQQATQSAPRTSFNQPFPSDPAKKASGRGRGRRYVSTKHNTCLHSGQRVGLHRGQCCTDSCQPELISCTLVEEFQDLLTPGEFLDLGLVDFVAAFAKLFQVTSPKMTTVETHNIGHFYITSVKFGWCCIHENRPF